jgi:bifunctional non-homologous end joining protein LigD
LVGFYEQDKLKYAGKVGTGYDEETLEILHEKMKKVQQSKSPFEDTEIKEEHVHWLKPELVGQFRYTEWTSDHKLRHPSFLGLRQDKKARDIGKEA